MVSAISLIINSVISLFTYALRAIFSFLTWFLKAFLRFLKYCYIALPITSIVFVLLMMVNVYTLMTGSAMPLAEVPATSPKEASSIESFADLQGDVPSTNGVTSSGDIKESSTSAFMDISERGRIMTLSVFSQLKEWWITSIYIYHGSAAYMLLLFITVLMFIPVMTVFLCLTALLSYGRVLFIAVTIDAAIYLLRAILGKTFISQAMGRYYKLFKDAGRRHEEMLYTRNLREKNREFEREKRARRQSAEAVKFYEDADAGENETYGRNHINRHIQENRFFDTREDFSDDYDSEFDEEYSDDYDPEFDEEYSDDYDPEPDEEYGDDDDNYEDDEDIEDSEDERFDDRRRSFHGGRHESDSHSDNSFTAAPASSFDFFAGCNSRESVDKKYKSLVKLYHPDNMDGDTKALQEINVQYDKARKRF